MNAKPRIDHTHACQSCCQPCSHPYGGVPVPSLRSVVNAYDTAVILTAALFTGKEPDLSPDIKEEFAELCEEHGIPRGNVIDLTKTGKSGLMDFSHPEYLFYNRRNNHVLALTLQIAALRPETEERPEAPGGHSRMRARRGWMGMDEALRKH